MGLYLRADSKYWWMLLERSGQKPIQESTRVLHDAQSAIVRRDQKQLAQQVYIARMNDLARGLHGLPKTGSTIPFRKYAAWFERHRIATRRGAERDSFALKPLLAFFDQRDLGTIDRAAVHEYITQRLTRVKAATVNREVDLLKGMFREAVPRYLAASPILGLKKLRATPIRKRVLTLEEETRLLAAFTNPADRAFYLVAVDTLIRLSNVVNLKWADVRGGHLDLDDSKTGPYRVPLSTRARAALDSLTKSGEYCFPHRRTAEKTRDTRGAIRRLLQRACARCEPPIPYGRAIGGITFHTATRATGATRMLRAGVDPKTVQAVGNWKSFEQMGEYLLTDPERMQAAVNLIGGPPLTSPQRRKRKTTKRRAKSA